MKLKPHDTPSPCMSHTTGLAGEATPPGLAQEANMLHSPPS